MPLSSAVVKNGATWAPTGGTDLTFAADGRLVKDGLSIIVAGDTNLLTRRSAELKTSLPAAAATSDAFAKLARASLVYRHPFIAADGKLYRQQIRMELSTHAEFTSRSDMVGLMAAFASDSDFTNFWVSLLLA